MTNPDCTACFGTGYVHAGKSEPEPCKLCNTGPEAVLAAALRETSANLDAYIDRYAQEQAAERVAEAQATANAAIREARAETEEVRALLEREVDLTAELRRRLDGRDSQIEQAQDARVRIANAVGEMPYKQWPILAAKVELRLAEQDAATEEAWSRKRLVIALQRPAVTAVLKMLESEGGTPGDLADAILEALNA